MKLPNQKTDIGIATFFMVQVSIKPLKNRENLAEFFEELHFIAQKLNYYKKNLEREMLDERKVGTGKQNIEMQIYYFMKDFPAEDKVIFVVE